MPAFVLRLAASSLNLGPITGAAGTRRIHLLATDHPGVFVAPTGTDVLVASLDVLVAGLNVGNVFIGLDSLHALVVLETLAALNVLDTLVRLDTLGTLDALNRSGTLNALHVLAASISELLLQIYILELHVAVVRGIEFPVLELAAAGEIHLVEFAVQHGVGLDRRETAVSPIVVVPQRGTDEERRTESEGRPDRPPGWMPEERRVGRRPVA